jgi:hypothetical protein
MPFAENIKSGVYASTHLYEHKAVCTLTINTISLLEVSVLAATILLVFKYDSIDLQ